METQSDSQQAQQMDFTREKHIKYLSMLFQSTSERLAPVECHKIFNLYFVLSGFDILGGLDTLKAQKQQIIDFVYNQQCTAFSKENDKSFGFMGGPYLGFNIDGDSKEPLSFDSTNPHYTGNLVYTFPALCILLMLGDDLSRVDKASIIKGLKHLQLEDGCFLSTLSSNESDLRAMYAACAVSHLLNDWSGIDIEKACSYILKCQNYDSGFGFQPDGESHGAATFLAVACLTLLKKEELISNKGQIVSWVLNRQWGGFQGRINKLMDSCYSFWLSGTLQVLGFDGLINHQEVETFLSYCQTPHGGFSKYPETESPDLIHTIHSLFGLSINKRCSIKPLKALLNMTEETYKKWEDLKF